MKLGTLLFLSIAALIYFFISARYVYRIFYLKKLSDDCDDLFIDLTSFSLAMALVIAFICAFIMSIEYLNK